MTDTTESRSHTDVDIESLEKHDVPQDKIGNNDDLQKPEESQQHAYAAPEVPEGGTKAWLAVLGASAALFTSFGWTNCIGLFQDEYQSNQLKEYSSSTVSWITSVQCMHPPPPIFLLSRITKLTTGKFSSCWLWPPWQAKYLIATVPASHYSQDQLRMSLD